MTNIKIKTFEDILAWKKSHKLTLSIYKITEKYPKIEEFGLKQHTRRTAFSVPSNIAEGFKRKSNTDSSRFYNISEGSLEELKYQLLLAKDLGYIGSSDYIDIFELAEETGRLLYGWKKSLQRFKD